MKDSGLYQLLLYLPENKRIIVGSKGVSNFNAGYYIYTGSAKRNLNARVSRHIKHKKKLRWHIDYLTSRALCIAHRCYLTPSFSECELHNATLKLSNASMPVKGFGASDCRCYSHLTYFRLRDDAWQIFNLDFTVKKGV